MFGKDLKDHPFFWGWKGTNPVPEAVWYLLFLLLKRTWLQDRKDSADSHRGKGKGEKERKREGKEKGGRKRKRGGREKGEKKEGKGKKKERGKRKGKIFRKEL